jgi:hypothetical protein
MESERFKDDLPKGAVWRECARAGDLLDSLTEKVARFLTENDERDTSSGGAILREFGAVSSITGWKKPWENAPSGTSKEFFNGALYPEIDGERYHRGIEIPRKEGTILLYVPYMFNIPKTKPFQIYSLGKISDAEIIEVVKTYCERFEKHIERRIAKAENSDAIATTSDFFRLQRE